MTSRSKRQRGYNLRARYGITVADFDLLLALQGGGCAICDRTDNLHVDHDHATGAIRGILCHGCNVGLGHFRDDPDRLTAALGYLGFTGTPKAA